MAPYLVFPTPLAVIYEYIVRRIYSTVYHRPKPKQKRREEKRRKEEMRRDDTESREKNREGKRGEESRK